MLGLNFDNNSNLIPFLFILLFNFKGITVRSRLKPKVNTLKIKLKI